MLVSLYKMETKDVGKNARRVDCGDTVAKCLILLLFDRETRVRLTYKGNLMERRSAVVPDYFDFPQFKKENCFVEI